MCAQRVIIAVQGAANEMKLEEFEPDPPGAGEVTIEQKAIGLNYMDVYQREGKYPLPMLPSPLGLEAAGVITAIGEGVSDLAIGDRVAYSALLGAYATHRNAPAARLIKIPDSITDEVAAAVMMKGMTVEYLLNRVRKIEKGMSVLFWAASGGVGQLAGQWGAHLGARMIGVTSGPKNCEMIKKLGYAEAIDRHSEDVTKRVLELTGGEGVNVVYDPIGKATFETSINSLAKFGLMVNFGATTGLPPDVSPMMLQLKGSLHFTRCSLADYIGTRELLVHSASETFRMVEEGALKVNINQRMPLVDIVAVHETLERGETTGSTVLIP